HDCHRLFHVADNSPFENGHSHKLFPTREDAGCSTTPSLEPGSGRLGRPRPPDRWSRAEAAFANAIGLRTAGRATVVATVMLADSERTAARAVGPSRQGEDEVVVGGEVTEAEVARSDSVLLEARAR